MTQEQNHRSPTNRRAARPTRNRPMLVTSSTPTDSVTEDAPEQIPGKADTAETDTIAGSLQEMTETPRTRRLPGFFSRVGKSTQTETPEADEGAREAIRAPQGSLRASTARLARAMRGKAIAPVAKTSVPDKKSEASEPVKASPPTSARSAPARPSSGFKMRYILGLVIYLLGAQLLGAYESAFLRPIDSVLFSIGPVHISTSTLVFLATLVILLLVLARFDLIPRNLGAMMGQPTPSRKAGPAPSRTEESVKTAPPTMKQGVKGADDDLYQEYREQRRYQQRRDRKR